MGLLKLYKNMCGIKKKFKLRTANYSDLDIIEKIGGGSARCMIAENFLQKK